MKRSITIILAASSLFLAGCRTMHEHSSSKWEYKTVVLPNTAVPLVPAGTGWTSDDAVLNAMLKDGWFVAGYGIDQSNSQWFLLKRHKR